MKLVAKFILLMTICSFAQTKNSDVLTFTNAEGSAISNAVLAKVGSLKITAKEFLYGYEFGPGFVKHSKDSKKKYLNYLVNEKLLAEDGFKRGLDKEEIYKNYYNAIKGDLTSEELYRKEVSNSISVSEKEIESGVKQKLITLKIKWLYSNNEKKIIEYIMQLKSGISFDSLYITQFNDSVLIDERSLESDRFSLGKKNPLLAGIIDTVKAGEVTPPIHTSDGWYIVKLDNITRSVLPNETEINKLSYDARTAIEKSKMDSASDVYVNRVMMDMKPVIKKRALIMLRSYIGKYSLPDQKYKDWQLQQKLDAILDSLKNSKIEDSKSVELVVTKDYSITINDFMRWFQLRSESIKLDQSSLKGYSVSLENILWRMVRDELLLKQACNKGYDKSAMVAEQSEWWKDKIMFAVSREEITKSISVNKELQLQKDIDDATEKELTKKMLHKINSLKQNTKVEINEELLSKISVDQENDRKAIDVYIVKPGGYFPRQAFPSIDLYWRNWE